LTAEARGLTGARTELTFEARGLTTGTRIELTFEAIGFRSISGGTLSIDEGSGLEGSPEIEDTTGINRVATGVRTGPRTGLRSTRRGLLDVGVGTEERILEGVNTTGVLVITRVESSGLRIGPRSIEGGLLETDDEELEASSGPKTGPSIGLRLMSGGMLLIRLAEDTIAVEVMLGIWEMLGT
jgi:hypothetical protein